MMAHLSVWLNNIPDCLRHETTYTDAKMFESVKLWLDSVPDVWMSQGCGDSMPQKQELSERGNNGCSTSYIGFTPQDFESLTGITKADDVKSDSEIPDLRDSSEGFENVVVKAEPGAFAVEPQGFGSQPIHPPFKKTKFQCDKCDFIATNSSSMSRHKAVVHEGILYPCDQCNYVATRTDHLKSHKEAKHEGIRRFACDQCNFTSTTASNLKTHRESKHDGVRYPCDKCKYVATTVGHLKRHKENKHDERMSYPCDQCGACFSRPKDLKRHKETNMCFGNPAINDSAFNIEDFSNIEGDLSLNEAGPAGVEDVELGQAQVKFEHGIFSHKDMTIELPKRKFQCDQCEFEANSQPSLSRHKAIIHDGTRYPCDQCSYVGTRIANLKAHKETKHEGIRRFRCDQCDYSSAAASNLKAHRESKHEGIRYPCDQCNYAATTAGHLRRHKDSKHDRIRHPCEQCGASFSRADDLKKHIIFKH